MSVSLFKAAVTAFVLLLVWQLGYAFIGQHSLMNLLDFQAWLPLLNRLWPMVFVWQLLLVVGVAALLCAAGLQYRSAGVRFMTLLLLLALALSLPIALGQGQLPHWLWQQPLFYLGQLGILLACFSWLLPGRPKADAWFSSTR